MGTKAKTGRQVFVGAAAYVNEIVLPEFLQSCGKVLYEGPGSCFWDALVCSDVFCHIPATAVLHHQKQASFSLQHCQGCKISFLSLLCDTIESKAQTATLGCTVQQTARESSFLGALIVDRFLLVLMHRLIFSEGLTS